MKEKIVLINVYYSESGYGTKLNFPPVGLAYISEYLDVNKSDHIVFDMGLGLSSEYILGKIAILSPSIIGLSINSLQLNKTKEFIEKIRICMPASKIIVGGPHVTTRGERVFLDLPNIDFGIAGEGEESFFELISDVTNSNIPGLIYKDDSGEICSNPCRITKNIDSIPFPKFKKFDLQAYSSKTIPLISSRGCPFKCIFCQQSSLLSKNWRGVSAEYFVDAIRYWKDAGYNEIQILDDNFTFDISRLRNIAKLYESNNISGINLILVGGVRISSANEETLTLLKKLGVDYISFGVESLNDKVLRFIKKGTNKGQIEKRVKMSIKMGFKVRLFFIIGFPYQTREQMNETYRFVLKYLIYQVRFFNLIPYDNTELMDWISINGSFIFPPDQYMNDFKSYQNIPVFKAKNTMSPEDRAEELKIANHVSYLVSERSKFLFDDCFGNK